MLWTWRQYCCWERVSQLSSANICSLMETCTSLSMFSSRTESGDEKVGFPCNYCYAAWYILPSVSCLKQTILSTKYNANCCYDFWHIPRTFWNDMASIMLFMQAAHLNSKYLGTHSHTKAPNQYVNRLSAIWKHRHDVGSQHILFYDHMCA